MEEDTKGRKIKGRGANKGGESRYAGDAGVFESIDGGAGPGPQRCELSSASLHPVTLLGSP